MSARAKRRQAERKLRRQQVHADDHEKQPPSTVLPNGQFITVNRRTRRALARKGQW